MANFITAVADKYGSAFYYLKKKFTARAGASMRARALGATRYQIFINGKRVCEGPCTGPIHTRFYDEMVLDGYLREGENEITVRLFTTLHNIIGPFHRPLGNVGNTFGGGYTNPDAAWLSVDTTQEGWEMHMEDFYPNWTDQYNVAPLGLRDAAIVIPLN